MATTTAGVAADHGKSLRDVNMSAKEHRRAQIEAEITRLNQSVVKLKSELNMLSPISILPQEILAEIFITLWQAVKYEVDQYPYLGRSYSVRFLITHVCAHWRVVALGCPALWATLKVPSAPAVLQEVLERAKCAPLRLDACIQAHDLLSKDQTMTILGRLSHIRALSVTAPSETLSEISDKMDGPIPLLESLKLKLIHIHFTRGDAVGQTSLPASLRIEPRAPIRELELDNFAFSWTDIAFRSLSRLELRCHCDRAGQDNSLQDFINALENMPLLEVLELEYTAPSLPSSVTEIPAPTRVITLTRLRSILLVANTPADCIYVLSHLSFPSLSTFSLQAESTRHSMELANCLAGKVPFWKRIRRLDCTMDPDDCYRIEGSGWQAGYSGVNEDYSSPRYTFDLLFVEETTPPTVLTTMLEHIPWRIVRTLVVSNLSYESASQWIAAFRPLKQVTTLEVWSDTGTLALAQALCSLDLQVGRPTRKTSMKLFPLLRSISLKSMCFAERETYGVGLVGELTESLLDCLARRRDRGVEIRKLQITNCYNIDDRDIERLREIVPSAEWDGKVMVDVREPE